MSLSESTLINIIIIVIIIIITVNLFSCLTVEKFDQPLSYAKTSDPYQKPSIWTNLIDKKKCQEIINYAKDKLFDSQVIGGRHENIRNSQQTWISKNNPIVKSIFETVSNKYNIPFENAEDLQVVRYLPNQYYKEHHDSCCDNNEKCLEFFNRGGQRKLTVLIYLNDNFTEGETYFKNLNLKLKTEPGNAIIFYPLADNSNKCHPLALHAGLPVRQGEKWIANLWYRENKFV